MENQGYSCVFTSKLLSLIILYDAVIRALYTLWAEDGMIFFDKF